tara:strand:+ start:43 stop:312 length:270 start_codon:yes stop_codon:yes gene_type:complete
MDGGSYKDFYCHGSHLRKIFANAESSELEWHRDKNNRTIHIVFGENWELQMDNELPKKLEQGKEYHIKKNTFHRVFSGKDDLLIRIEEE